MGWEADIGSAQVGGYPNRMSDLPTTVIAMRAAALWIAGLLAVAVIAAQSETNSSGSRNGLRLLGALAARILMYLGPAGLALIVGRSARGLSDLAAYSAVGVSVIVSMWFTAICAQVAQNSARRAIGAKSQPIRWWAGHDGKRHRRSKGRRTRNDR